MSKNFLWLIRVAHLHIYFICKYLLHRAMGNAWVISNSAYSTNTSMSYAGFRLACRLPLCRVIIACCFRVAALSGNAALALSPSSIAPELNRIQLSAICRGGQSGKVIDLLAWRCLPLGHPSAASGACAVEQISSSKRQCGKRQVSLKPALSSIVATKTWELYRVYTRPKVVIDFN